MTTSAYVLGSSQVWLCVGEQLSVLIILLIRAASVYIPLEIYMDCVTWPHLLQLVPAVSDFLAQLQ